MEAVLDTDIDVGIGPSPLSILLSVSVNIIVNIISLSHILDFVNSFCSCCAAVAL